jgi:hypothetical protein
LVLLALFAPLREKMHFSDDFPKNRIFDPCHVVLPPEEVMWNHHEDGG